MSNFDFKKLRQQCRATGEMLRENFKVTDTMLIAIAQRDADPTYVKNKNNALKTAMTKETWKENNKKAVEKWKNDPQWQKEQKERHERLMQNEQWNKNVRVAAKEKSRPCITPLGIFPRVHAAGDYYDQQRGTKCGRTVVCRNLKKGTEGYRYISVEEYIMLTGKEI